MLKQAISQKKANAKKETFTGIMHTVDFEVMYKVKLKRIGKEYSQEQTAFLMGKHKGYISAKERFETSKGYTVEDICRLSSFLDLDPPSFIPPKYIKGENTYIGVEFREAGKIYHEARVQAEKNKPGKFLFRLYEHDQSIILHPESQEQQFNKLKVFLDVLWDAGYFNEAKTPAEIFARSKRLMQHYITPSLVERVINYFIAKKKIKKILDNGYNVYINYKTIVES